MPSDEARRPRRRSGGQRLRFGLICGAALEAWQAQVLQELKQIDGLELVVAIVTDSAGTERVPALFGSYQRYLCRAESSRPVSLDQVLPGVCRLVYQATRSGGLERPDAPDVETIRLHDLDVLLQLDSRPVQRDWLSSARYGVWRFSHGGLHRDSSGPAGFWEIFRGERTTDAALLRLTNSEGTAVVLRKGRFRTLGHSYAANLDNVRYESAAWVADVSRDILRGHSAYVDGPPVPVAAPTRARPSSGEMVRFWLKLARNRAVRAYEEMFLYDSWNVAVVDEPIGAFVRRRAEVALRWLPTLRRSQFAADPFGVWRGGDLHLLAEQFDYWSNLGVISHATVEVGGASRLTTVLRPGVHASYPYPVEHGGEIFCVPETYQAREAALYRAEPFPWRWRRERAILKDVAAVDSTLIFHAGRWWLYCTDQDRGPDFRLSIWHAPDLLGPWEPHPGNPVKCDITSARPAGTPFVVDGILYRPAQDCSTTYGGRVVINRVLELTVDSYREEPVAVIGPDPSGPYPHGVHHLAAAGPVTFLDGKRRRFIWAGLAHRVLQSVTRRTGLSTPARTGTGSSE